MDEDYYKEHVLSIVNGGDGWNDLYSSISEFKQHLNGGAALVEEELKHGWLLRHHSSNTSQLQYKIIALFKHIASVFWSRYFVQFWEAIRGEEGRCHYLSTSNQPFCVSTLRKGESWYRNACMDHVYHVEEGAEAEQLGSVGRAYNNKQPESTPDLRLYSTEEFPLRDHAARCGFRSYFTLPLFDLHHQNECYGVLEVFSHVPTMEISLLSWLDRGLQVNLRHNAYPLLKFNYVN